VAQSGTSVLEYYCVVWSKIFCGIELYWSSLGIVKRFVVLE